MEREFVPYELAMKLKALGFDESCFGYYVELVKPIEGVLTILHCDKNADGCLAPTFSQAFRWFREKHGLHQEVSIHTLLDENDEDRDEYYFSVRKLKPVEVLYSSDFIIEYEEAELACLDKLIEIIESKSE